MPRQSSRSSKRSCREDHSPHLGSRWRLLEQSYLPSRWQSADSGVFLDGSAGTNSHQYSTGAFSHEAVAVHTGTVLVCSSSVPTSFVSLSEIAISAGEHPMASEDRA